MLRWVKTMGNTKGMKTPCPGQIARARRAIGRPRASLTQASAAILVGARPQTASVRHKVGQQRQEGFVSGANRLVPLTLPAQSTRRPATPDAPATLAR